MNDKAQALIHVVEDDANVARLITGTLERFGYRHAVFPSGGEFLRQLRVQSPDLAILDLGLPDMDGMDVLQQLRKRHRFGLLIATGRVDTYDRVLGLELGADDYMIKPFDSKELVARVKAVLRRYQPPVQTPASSVTEQHGNFVEYPDLIVNLTNYSVIYNGHSIELPPKELELLYFLASSPNQVFTREQLLDHIWGYEYIGDTRTVDVHIKRLREKIKGNDKWALTTVWGIGYKFEVKR